LLLSFAGQLMAQTLSGISGTVADKSGAVLPDAKITATNDATQVPSFGTSSSVGAYTITDLIPGTYTVRVEKSGFQTALHKKVIVEVSRMSTVDATLGVGATTETVEVTADAITLDTVDPEIGTTIENKLVDELPVEIGNTNGGVGARGRQIDAYIFLTPGVTGGTFSHRINGSLDFQNEVVFNGVPVVQSETQGFQSNINPPFEMVNEFRVVSTNFSSQYGLASGAASYQFASGTDRFHADGFEILRNNLFDAKGGADAFVDANGHPITPVDREHNFGFSVGGPVVFPKLYNGRGKTFFRASLEWYRFNQGVNTSLSVPTAAMKQGDFSAFPFTIFVPDASVTLPAGCVPGAAPGQPFPGNRIPQSCFSTVSKSLVGLIPNPTLGGFVNNLPSQLHDIPTRNTLWGFSIDHHLTQNQSLHGSFWRNKYNTPAEDNGSPFNNILSDLKNEPRLGTGVILTYSNAISTHLVMTAGMGWMGEINNEVNPNQNFKFAGVSGGSILPTMSFGDNAGAAISTWGVNGNGETVSINRKLGLSFDNNWLWVHGRHTFNIGGEVRRAYQDDHECQNCGGGFSFTSATTDDPNNLGTAGSSFASFLLGLPDTGFRQFAAESKLRNLAFSPYFQDNVKLTRKLTVDAGLRWDIMRPFTVTGNSLVFLDATKSNPGAINPATGQPLLGAASVLGTCATCVGYDRADIHWRNFGPRLGFAYELTNKMVVRGGYSLSFLDGGAYEFGNNKVANNYGQILTGNFVSNSNGNNIPGYGQWDIRPMPNPPPTPFTSTIGNGSGILHAFAQNDGGAPYVQMWNAGIQRELPHNLFVSVAYIGNRGIHLPAQLDNPNHLDPSFLSLCNPATPNTCVLSKAWTSPAAQAVLQSLGFGQSGGFFTPYANYLTDFGSGRALSRTLRTFPQFAAFANNFDLQGSSRYQAVQINTQKRFSDGLSFLVNYTLSRTMSNTDSGFSTFNGSALNSFNQRAEWSVSGNDQTHVANINIVYELPLGPGKRFLNHGGTVAKNFLGGWQFSTITSYSSGTPFGFSASGAPLTTFNRPNIVAGVPFNIDWNNYYNGDFNGNGVPVINGAAFVAPGNWVIGTAPRNLSSVRSPYNANENMGLAKRLFLGERVTAEMRVEFFNVLNRMQICGFDSGVGGIGAARNPNFGIINGGHACQANTPRQGQMFFKLSF